MWVISLRSKCHKQTPAVWFDLTTTSRMWLCKFAEAGSHPQTTPEGSWTFNTCCITCFAPECFEGFAEWKGKSDLSSGNVLPLPTTYARLSSTHRRFIEPLGSMQGTQEGLGIKRRRESHRKGAGLVQGAKHRQLECSPGSRHRGASHGSWSALLGVIPET